MNRKLVLAGAIVFFLITAWYGSNLILFMVDYKDELISLNTFKVSIMKVEAKEDDTFTVAVSLNNSYSRDISIRLITFHIFEKKTDTLLTSGMIDYTIPGRSLILPGYAERTEEFNKKTIVQIEHGAPIEIRVEVRVMINSLYSPYYIMKAEINATVTFY